ncbi:SPOR domain-containing protein [Variovorax ureilyticus]|uniref:SPOR domain-containing protein n=1 Tax=Variovorax ureilyticus TaxID=1836198 RepID=UPI003D66F6C3
MKQRQSGNTVIGLIIGLVLGLGVALGIAVYVTKVPIPFMTKTQRGGPEQDEAEARKNRDWDPNAPLAGKSAQQQPARPPATTASASPTTAAPQPATVGPLNPSSAPVPVVVAPGAKSTDTAPARPRTAPVPAEANATPSSDPLGDLARARAGIGGPGTTTAHASAGSSSGADPFIYFVQAGAFRTSEDAEAQRAKLSLMGVEAKVTEREQAGRTVYRVRAGPFNKKEDADLLKERLDGGGLESALVRVQR